VARTGFFSRHPDSTADADEQMAERDRMIADTAPTARERAAAVGRAAVEERRGDAERTVADERRQAEHDRMIDRDRTDDETWVRYPTTPEPHGEAPAAPVAPTTAPDTEPETRTVYARVHTSMLAMLALVVGTVATCAALTGRLAPVAIVIGALGALLSFGGLSAASRRGVNGHGVALLALLLSAAGIAFGVMAMNHTVPWLNADTDQASQMRDWLNTQLPWLKNW
jgi:hypothetical protein